MRPFSIDADVGGYWLTWLKSRTPTAAMGAFHEWLVSVFLDGDAGTSPDSTGYRLAKNQKF